MGRCLRIRRILSFQVEYTEVDVKLGNLTDDELSDDEVMQRSSSRLSPTTTPMETEEQREGEEDEEEEDVPEGKHQVKIYSRALKFVYKKSSFKFSKIVIKLTHLGCRDGAVVQGWHSGESTHLPPLWPGFDSQIWRQMWVELVGSLLCTERFSPGTLFLT